MTVVDLRDNSVSMNGVTWPDGRSLLEQPVKLLYAFEVIGMIYSKVNKPKEDE